MVLRYWVGVPIHISRTCAWGDSDDELYSQKAVINREGQFFTWTDVGDRVGIVLANKACGYWCVFLACVYAMCTRMQQDCNPFILFKDDSCAQQTRVQVIRYKRLQCKDHPATS